jgi:Mce-associated membrane protein
MADDTDADDEAPVTSADDEDLSAPCEPRSGGLRLVLACLFLTVLSVAGLTAWFGYRTWQSYQADQEHQLFLRVGSQGAQDLATISYTQVDADVKRILDISTGDLHADFQQRAQPLIDYIKKFKSSTQGTVTAAAFQSTTGDSARLLVAVSMKMTSPADPDQAPKSYRMRVDVTKVGGVAKVSNVAFVE